MLHPDDLEPVPQLEAAIKRIQVWKDIDNRRKLHRHFGQLWCQRVTIGGRLQPTKILTSTEKKSEQE
jgi:hypothetical protein